jgi:hypothetical protein
VNGLSAPGSPPAYGDEQRAIYLESINARLAKLFGFADAVRWSATIVESVTPAVIDEDW